MQSNVSETTKDRVTLDRAFSKWGMSSRAEAAEQIRAGRVTVNGKVIRNPDCWVSLKQDRIYCSGRELKPRKRICLMLYKPAGVVTTFRDPSHRKTVYDCLRDLKDWVFPVGRLDKDTSGLLLMTNDTQLSEALTNPRSKVSKTYLVKVNFLPTGEQLTQLQQGMTLKNGKTTLPAQVRVLRHTQKCAFLEMVIVEGKNRQIRRMIEGLGGKVLKLVRTRIGELELGDLLIGKYRNLNQQDLRKLRR